VGARDAGDHRDIVTFIDQGWSHLVLVSGIALSGSMAAFANTGIAGSFARPQS
jgi:hypothetical protein